MSRRARHFPVVAPGAAMNQDGGIKIRKTQILVKPAAVFSRQITRRKYPNAAISRLCFHIKSTAVRRVSRVVSRPAADVMTNGCWRRDECWNGVLCHCSKLDATVGQKVGNSSFHVGHSTTYTVPTYITLMIIKDRPGKPPATLVKELPCTFLSLY